MTDIEYQKPEEIKAFQEGKLHEALQYLKQHSPYYQRMFASYGIDTDKIQHLEDMVKRIIGSDGEVGSNKNDINTERGKWKLIVDYLWTPATGSPYILMSSEGLKATMGTRFWNRTVLDIENEEKVESRNLVYNGFARWSCGFPNWRHVLMGGSSDASATTLS